LCRRLERGKETRERKSKTGSGNKRMNIGKKGRQDKTDNNSGEGRDGSIYSM
jgi:hypothetical protein